MQSQQLQTQPATPTGKSPPAFTSSRQHQRFSSSHDAALSPGIASSAAGKERYKHKSESHESTSNLSPRDDYDDDLSMSGGTVELDRLRKSTSNELASPTGGKSGGGGGGGQSLLTQDSKSRDSVFKDDSMEIHDVLTGNGGGGGDVNGNIELYVKQERLNKPCGRSNANAPSNARSNANARSNTTEPSGRNSSTETADSVDSNGRNPVGASMGRHMLEGILTPEVSGVLPSFDPGSLTALDDNCNLKENLDRMVLSAFGKLGIDNYCMAASLNAAGLSAAGLSAAGLSAAGLSAAGLSAAAVMSTPALIGLPAMDGNGREGEHTATTSANSSISISPLGGQSNRTQQNRGGGGGDRTGDDPPDIPVEYPMLFPGLKHQLSIRNETVIISRLDGVNNVTGDKVSLYKCYLCGRVFQQLSVLQLHLSTHFEKRVTYYQCLYCDACYRFKAQLVQHLQTHHRLQLNLEEGQIPQVSWDC